MEKQTWQERLRHQAEVTLRSTSTWVGLVMAALVGAYMELPATTQQSILDMFPFLKGWGGVISVLLPILLARLKPSGAVSSQTQAVIDEAARLRLNEFLRARGLPVAADPTPPALPLPNGQILQPTPAAPSIVDEPVAPAEPMPAVVFKVSRAAPPGPDEAPAPAPAPSRPATTDEQGLLELYRLAMARDPNIPAEAVAEAWTSLMRSRDIDVALPLER